jgi:hypothetical protein
MSDEETRPCRLGMSAFGSQVICRECGDECECYLCVPEGEEQAK